MEYENDPLLPILSEEILSRTEAFKGLTAEEESKLLALTADQKRIIAENDKMTKTEYLKQLPKLSHPTLKGSDKYLSFTNSIGASAHWECMRDLSCRPSLLFKYYYTYILIQLSIVLSLPIILFS